MSKSLSTTKMSSLVLLTMLVLMISLIPVIPGELGIPLDIYAVVTTAEGQETILRNEAIINSQNEAFTSPENWNPYNPIMLGHHWGQRSSLTEYLFYFMYNNATVKPWLATGYQYSADFKTLTIKIRPGVKWSDGQPFTAKDVAFTVNMLIKDPTCSYPDIVSGISKAYATDNLTYVCEYKAPSPHAYEDYVLNYMLGLSIVPEHIFGPATTAGTGTIKPSDYEYHECVWTGPYKKVQATEDGTIMKRRDDWWALQQGFWTLPGPKWVVQTKLADTVLPVIKNEVDAGGTESKSAYLEAKKTNPYLLMHQTLDPCPRCLYANLYKYPLSLKEVRHAIAHAINQTKVIDVGFEGLGEIAQFHAPTFASMKRYMPYDWLATATGNFTGVAGSPYAGQTITYSLDAAKYDTALSQKILEGLGFKKVNGWWTSPNGTKCEWTILNQMWWSPSAMATTQTVVEQLRNFGFDVVMKTPNSQSLPRRHR